MISTVFVWIMKTYNDKNIYNIRTLSENIKFICTSLAGFYNLFSSELWCQCFYWYRYPSWAPEFTPGFSVVRANRSLVLCVCFVDRCLSFCTFSVGHCVVCSSSIYRFWLPLWHVSSNSSYQVFIMLDIFMLSCTCCSVNLDTKNILI
jgi:hypothetical protein